MKSRRHSRRFLPTSQFVEDLEVRVLFSTYTVTSLGDGAGTVTPVGAGKFNASTLRAAMAAANAHIGADTINFAAAVQGTINLGKALPEVADTLTLTGPGSSKLTLQRSFAATTDFSILHVNAGKSAWVSGLRITRGSGNLVISEVDRNWFGGGIWNAGTLKVSNCTITGNTAGGASADYGGGIYNLGNLTLTGSTVSGNKSGEGGGIFSSRSLTITSSTISGNTADAAGGGIANDGGSATLNYCTIDGNTAGSPGGGGIKSGGGTLTLSNSTISANKSAVYGGGLQAQGSKITVAGCKITGNTASLGGGVSAFQGFTTAIITMTLINSTISGNTAQGDRPGSGGLAGGVAVYFGVVMNVINCTVSGNKAYGFGGLYNDGTTNLINSTLSGNSAYGGGGILTDEGTVNVINSTVYGNSATIEAGGITVRARGVVNLTNSTVYGNTSSSGVGGIDNRPGATLQLANSIVAGNWHGSSALSDIAGVAVSSSSYNVVGAGGAGGLKNGVNGNKVGVSLTALKLGPLANNGGPTKTMALLSGSIAINAGSNTVATNAKLYADQRGLPRKSGGRVDVGAFEVQAAGGASIAGTFFNDKNHDGVRQATTEPGLANWQVYVDQNHNGVYDAGEITTFTSSTGTYKFTGLAAGSYRIYEYRQYGWTRTKPAGVWPLGYYDLLLATNQTVSGKDFGNYFT
jgi:hypothetical protein